MGQIQIMPAALANQIAAGEVVERPSSCVKELIENSLDAGARKISVALMEGGISLIAVEDDGRGMDKEDALLAFARHATSKVKSERDLSRIHTLGFRGEALASIAAVAKVTLQTRMQASEHGWQVEAKGSDATTDPQPIGRAQGTRVEVRDLFFNTPARLKYLRTVHTEQTRCIEVVQRAALSRPDVAFRCEVSERLLFQTPGRGNLLDVLAVLYGMGEARQFLKVDVKTPDYQIFGYVGRPTQGKSSRVHGHWFINNRPIRNYGLHQAVVDGYQGRLMVRRHPVYALFLTLDATLVDVNIHPHKSEVRFSEERDITRLVQSAVAETLNEAFLVPNVTRSRGFGLKEAAPASASIAPANSASPADTQNYRISAETSGRPVKQENLWKAAERRDGYAQFAASARPTAEELAAATRLYQTNHLTESPNGPPAEDTLSEDALPGETLPKETLSEKTLSEEKAFKGEPSSSLEARGTRNILKDLRPIGQTLATFILAEADGTLFIIDQHAAHERVLYERFRNQTQGESVDIIPLLTPLTVRLTPAQRGNVLNCLEILASLGLKVEDFGGQEVIVRSIPQVWEGLDSAALAEALLQQIDAASPGVNPREALREKIIMHACKSAIKANQRLSDVEIRALCEALVDLDDPFHCPHGRPVFIKMSHRDLEREFRRIV